jgi:hypothetical protein
MSNKIPFEIKANSRREKSLLGGPFKIQSRVQMEANQKIAECQ